MKRVSILTIAEQANVSKTTVSFVLNGRGAEKKISMKTQAKIKEVAKKLGYTANHMARSLSLGHSKTIGFIVPNIGDPFFSTFGKYVEKFAEERGYSVLFSGTNENENKENQCIMNLVGRNIDGLILAPTQGFEKYLDDEYINQVPTIYFDRISDQQTHSFVDVDNYDSSKNITQLLIEKGHKNIAVVSLTSYLPNLSQRIRGYKDAMIGAGLNFNNDLFIEVDVNDKKRGVIQALKTLFDCHHDVTAIFFVNNLLAAEGVWVMNMYHKEKIENVEFACFDDLDIFDYSVPKVHSVVQPVEQMALSCVQQLCEKMSTNKNSIGERLQGTMIRR